MHIHRKFWFHYFLGVTPFLNLEFWPKWKILLFFLVSATPLKPLNRISWNFVDMKDIMCRYAYPQEILSPFFFSELRPFWTSKFDGNERTYWYSWSAQLSIYTSFCSHILLALEKPILMLYGFFFSDLNFWISLICYLLIRDLLLIND